MNCLDVSRMIVSPRASHPFRINVVWHDIVIVREPVVADCANAVLSGDFSLHKFTHFCGGPQFAVSPWVVWVLDALHTHLHCCSAFVAGGFPATAITRSVDWTEFIATEPHGDPPRLFLEKKSLKIGWRSAAPLPAENRLKIRRYALTVSSSNDAWQLLECGLGNAQG
jgi:hypothetical protein